MKKWKQKTEWINEWMKSLLVYKAVGKLPDDWLSQFEVLSSFPFWKLECTLKVAQVFDYLA